VNSIDLIAACWTTAGDAVPLDGRQDSPLSLPERISAAAAAGFTGFGVVHNDLANYLAGGHDLKELRERLDEAGMRYVELEFLTGWWLPTAQRAASDSVLRQLLEAAEQLGAYRVKIGPDIEHTDFDLDRYAEHFYRVADAFARTGTLVALEFMPFSNIATLAQGLELVRTAGHPNGGLMVDLWHLVRGSGTLDELSRVPLEHITGVELDDGDAEQVGTGYADTVLRRKLCGQGRFPVADFIRTMRSVGWPGPWGVEIISEQYRKRPVRQAVAEAFTTTMAAFAEAG
jgi:sugar phosphate isomerase/epimerase